MFDGPLGILGTIGNSLFIAKVTMGTFFLVKLTFSQGEG